MKKTTNKPQPQATDQTPVPVMIYNPQPVEPTMRSIMKKKYLTTLENSSAGAILLAALDVFMGIVICAFLVFPESTSVAIQFVMSFYHFAVPKVIAGVLVIVILRNRKAVMRFIKPRAGGANQHTLEGVSVAELLDFLFRTGGFRLAEAKADPLFLSRKSYDRLAPKLEALEVLTRGPNNSRLLNPDMMREEVAAILKTSDRAKGLHRPLQVIQHGKKNFRTSEDLLA